jgi:hypothetical protein
MVVISVRYCLAPSPTFAIASQPPTDQPQESWVAGARSVAGFSPVGSEVLEPGWEVERDVRQGLGTVLGEHPVE